MQTVIDPVSLQLPQTVEPRNPGQDFNADWLRNLQANTSAIERRAKTLPGRRSVKKDHQAAWLLKAITCIDLTTLSGDDTAERVQRLCAKARQPLRADLLTALDMPQITTGAICVYHEMINPAVAALSGSGSHECTVAAPPSIAHTVKVPICPPRSNTVCPRGSNDQSLSSRR